MLKCHGRALKSLIGEEKLVQIELKAVARQVADKIIARLKQQPLER